MSETEHTQQVKRNEKSERHFDRYRMPALPLIAAVRCPQCRGSHAKIMASTRLKFLPSASENVWPVLEKAYFLAFPNLSNLFYMRKEILHLITYYLRDILR